MKQKSESAQFQHTTYNCPKVDGVQTKMRKRNQLPLMQILFGWFGLRYHSPNTELYGMVQDVDVPATVACHVSCMVQQIFFDNILCKYVAEG